MKSREGILEHIEEVNGEKIWLYFALYLNKILKNEKKRKIGLTMDSWMVYLGIYSE